MQYLQTEAGASVYTQRNYRQALHEFTDWYTTERKQPPAWLELKKLDFRGYLRFLGRVTPDAQRLLFGVQVSACILISMCLPVSPSVAVHIHW